MNNKQIYEQIVKEGRKYDSLTYRQYLKEWKGEFGLTEDDIIYNALKCYEQKCYFDYGQVWQVKVNNLINKYETKKGE